MPGSLVKHHDRMFIRVKFGRKMIKKMLHCLLVRVRHHPGVGLIGAGVHSGKEVGKSEAIVAFARRALAAPPPAMCHPAFLPDAGFILKPRCNALVFMCICNRLKMR